MHINHCIQFAYHHLIFKIISVPTIQIIHSIVLTIVVIVLYLQGYNQRYFA